MSQQGILTESADVAETQFDADTGSATPAGTGVLTAASGIDLLVALVIVLLVRPITGWIGLTGTDAGPRERQAIAFFGIRGVGSFYYLAHATNVADFGSVDRLWAIVSLVVVVSVVLHGVTASPIMGRIDRLRENMG